MVRYLVRKNNRGITLTPLEGGSTHVPRTYSRNALPSRRNVLVNIIRHINRNFPINNNTNIPLLYIAASGLLNNNINYLIDFSRPVVRKRTRIQEGNQRVTRRNASVGTSSRPPLRNITKYFQKVNEFNYNNALQYPPRNNEMNNESSNNNRNRRNGRE